MQHRKFQLGAKGLVAKRIHKHCKNTEKFESCPLRSKTLVSPGFFAYWANCFGFLCLSMPAGAAPVEIIVSCAALAPKNISVRRPVSRKSRFQTLGFLAKTCGFLVEVQDSN